MKYKIYENNKDTAYILGEDNQKLPATIDELSVPSINRLTNHKIIVDQCCCGHFMEGNGTAEPSAGSHF